MVMMLDRPALPPRPHRHTLLHRRLGVGVVPCTGARCEGTTLVAYGLCGVQGTMRRRPNPKRARKPKASAARAAAATAAPPTPGNGTQGAAPVVAPAPGRNGSMGAGPSGSNGDAAATTAAVADTTHVGPAPTTKVASSDSTFDVDMTAGASHDVPMTADSDPMRPVEQLKEKWKLLPAFLKVLLVAGAS